MALKYVGYTEKYKDEVIKCLRRNFDTLGNMQYSETGKWLDTISDYEWIDNPEKSSIPFWHGAVALDGDKIVGFFGLIYANRIINGEKKLVLNATTWTLDPGYTLYVISATKKFFLGMENITDFSALEQLVTLNKRFGLKVVDEKSYFFRKPKSKCLGVTKIVEANDIKDLIILQEYKDHIRYGVKCITYTTTLGLQEYIFYIVNHRQIDFFKLSWAFIVKATDPSSFSQRFNDIANSICSIEKVPYIQVDSHFMTSVPCKPIKIEAVNRMVKGNIGSNVDYLYSEYCMADQYAGKSKHPVFHKALKIIRKTIDKSNNK